MTLKTTLLRAALFLALLIPGPALAAQGGLCLPVTGTVSGLTFVQDVNAGFAALVSANSGASAPANPCGAAPVTGQFWLDSSAVPSHLRIYDGSNWLDQGAVDAVGHLWTPVVGGGAASIASATTTNLGSIPQNYLTVTGTTTITGFGSGMALGTAKVVRFSSALTLTYNATSMILPTTASITTRAGDTAFVVSLGGGNALVALYQRADGSPLLSVFADNLFRIANSADATKKLAFDLSSITTATTRTLTPPDANGVIMTDGQYPIFSSGQLTMSSSTVVKLIPYKGNLVSLPTGKTMTIPSAGVSATITSAVVNGTAGQTLSVSTLYYVYLANISGTPTLDFSTTGHATDTSSGIEIKTGDATRVLVGMVYPQTGPIFANDATKRLVATWFNRAPKQLNNNFTANRVASSSSYVELNTEIRSLFLSWGDAMSAFYSGHYSTGGGATNTTAKAGVSLDGSTSTTFYSTSAYVPGASDEGNMDGGGTFIPSEGEHYITEFGSSVGSNATFVVEAGQGLLSGVVVN